MKPLTYLIADDDLTGLELVKHYLQLVPQLQCIAECNNAMDAHKAMQVQMPDLMILDIEMPGLNGLQFVKSLPSLPFVIFISSHIHYAVEAFEVDAIDFIKKPITPERLIRSIEKVRHLLQMKQSTSHNEGFQSNDEDSFFIKENSAFVQIQYKEVMYAESLGDFVQLFLENGTKKMALVNLKNLEHQFPSIKFIRISRMYLVNKQHITSIDKEHITLGNVKLLIGKTYADAVMESIIGSKLLKRHV
jgi:DNA-binding LytR/AlgR family response regulator